MDPVKFVKHTRLTEMQFSLWTTGVLNGCSRVREQQLS